MRSHIPLLQIYIYTHNPLFNESFNVDEIEDYTRPWFAWCNSLFGGLIAHIIHTDLELLDAI